MARALGFCYWHTCQHWAVGVPSPRRPAQAPGSPGIGSCGQPDSSVPRPGEQKWGLSFQGRRPCEEGPGVPARGPAGVGVEGTGLAEGP